MRHLVEHIGFRLRKKLLDKIKVEDIKPSSRRYPYIAFKPEREPGDIILEVENLSKKNEAGEYLFRNTLTLRATPTADGWNVRYLYTDERWSEGTGTLAEWDGAYYWIALTSHKGFKARLRLDLQRIVPEPGA